MAATELAAAPVTPVMGAQQHAALSELRSIAHAAVGLIAATALGAVLELVDHDLFTSTPPHPTLPPTVRAISSIFVTNLRVAAVPFILIAIRFASARSTRTAGDLILAGILFANTVRIGLAIGRWQTQLVPYLPHLPLEYLAISVAAGSWLSARDRGVHGQRQELHITVAYAGVAVVLLVVAASVEVLLTPTPADAPPTPLAAVSDPSALARVAAAPPGLDPAGRRALPALRNPPRAQHPPSHLPPPRA